MEEENEQLDYDEDELIAARKKAVELQKAIELDGQKLTKTMAGSIADGNSSVPVPSVSIESSTMASAAADKQIQPVDSNPLKVTSTTTEAKATTSTTSAAVGSSGIQQPVVRYHVNPNFNRNKSKRKLILDHLISQPIFKFSNIPIQICSQMLPMDWSPLVRLPIIITSI